MEQRERVPDRADAERRFVGRYGGLARLRGFPSTVGQAFAVLLLSPRPLTADDLAERLGVSRSSAHASTRRLELLGVLERTIGAGERVTHFRIRSGGLASLMEDVLHQLREGRDLAAETLYGLGDGDPEVRERLESFHRIQASAIGAVEEVIRRHGTSRPPERPGSGDAGPSADPGRAPSAEKPHEEA